MTTYSWDGLKGHWSDAADWTPNSVPNSSRAIVDIPSGMVKISTGESFQAGSVSLNGTSGALALHRTGALSVSGNFFCKVGGWRTGGTSRGLQLDSSAREGGGSVAISGTLTNDGLVQVGQPNSATLSAATRLTLGGLINNGSALFRMWGSASHSATLVFSAGGPGFTANSGWFDLGFVKPVTLNNNFTNSGVFELDGTSAVTVTGDFVNKKGNPAGAGGNLSLDANGFGNGGSLTIDGTLTNNSLVQLGFENSSVTTTRVDGLVNYSNGKILIFGASTLRVTGRFANTGLVQLESQGSLGGGGTLTIRGTSTNDGTIALDETSGDGGSLLNVRGTLTNDGTIEIGNSSLSARSAVIADSVVNNGTIDVRGIGDGDETNVHATLHCAGAFTNDGSVNLNDDYDRIVGAVGGKGNFSLSDDASLEFVSGVSGGQTVRWGSGVEDKLILDQASSFDGTIDDFFTKGDQVVAETFAEAQTLLSYTQTGADSCSWTLTDGTQKAVLNFAGEPYAKSDFSIVSANHGAGLAIKFV